MENSTTHDDNTLHQQQQVDDDKVSHHSASSDTDSFHSIRSDNQLQTDAQAAKMRLEAAPFEPSANLQPASVEDETAAEE